LQARKMRLEADPGRSQAPLEGGASFLLDTLDSECVNTRPMDQENVVFFGVELI